MILVSCLAPDPGPVSSIGGYSFVSVSTARSLFLCTLANGWRGSAGRANRALTQLRGIGPQLFLLQYC